MKSELKQGIKQALGVVFYCAVVGTVMQNGSKIFGEKDTFMTPILVLTMFCVSVLTCTLIVFKWPYELFFDNKKKEALNVVVYTAITLVVFLLLLISLIIIVF